MRIRRLLLAATIGALAVGAPATTAFAQEYPLGTTEERDPGGEVLSEAVVRADPAPAAEARAAQQTLPVTGGDVVQLTIVGLALTAGGVVLVRRGRRPVAQPA